jgi:hypothetical protein
VDEAPEDAAVPRGDVPAIIEVIFAAPYLLGEPMIDALRAHDGEEAVHDAFRDPPRTDGQILDPTELILNRTPAKVDAPRLRRSERRLEKATEFGAFGLYFLLASRIPPVDAYRATSGLSGDRMITFRENGTTCVRADFRGRTEVATDRIRGALEAWAATMPAGSVEVGERAGDVELTACDPGSSVAAPADENLELALTILYVRNTVLADVLSQDAPPEFAACAADEYSTDSRVLALAQQATELDEAAQQELAQVATSAGVRCRARAS